jgi:hypothetical protein
VWYLVYVTVNANLVTGHGGGDLPKLDHTLGVLCRGAADADGCCDQAPGAASMFVPNLAAERSSQPPRSGQVPVYTTVDAAAAGFVVAGARCIQHSPFPRQGGARDESRRPSHTRFGAHLPACRHRRQATAPATGWFALGAHTWLALHCRQPTPSTALDTRTLVTHLTTATVTVTNGCVTVSNGQLPGCLVAAGKRHEGGGVGHVFQVPLEAVALPRPPPRPPLLQAGCVAVAVLPVSSDVVVNFGVPI